MFGEHVIVNNERYVLGAYLASGMIGTVYPAWKEDDPNKTPIKAVKIPAPNLSSDLQKNFWSEFEHSSKFHQ